jgi:hypothetical protein
MNEPTCPNECVNGLVHCGAEEAEYLQDGNPMMECPHCSNRTPAPASSRREDFHADV